MRTVMQSGIPSATIMTSSNMLRRSTSRRLLLLLAASLVVASVLPTSQGSGISSGRSVGRQQASSGRDAADYDEDEDEDEDEDDDDDAWGFLDAGALLSAAGTTSTQATPPGRPCAETLPAALLDDDYCDCEADGSDEPSTSACSHVTDGANRLFACHAGDQRVPLAFVGDGVCDCCDGSDELSAVTASGGTACPNVCLSYYEGKRDRLAETLATIERGLVIREKYLSRADGAISKLQGDFQFLLSVYRELHGEVQLKQEALRAAGAPPSMEQLEDLDRVRYELMGWQNRAFVAQRVVSSATFDADALGMDLSNWKRAFAPLVGQCFRATVDEKQLKGGTPNVIPRTYEFQFCPFQNITQHEPAYPEWTRNERRRKHADLTSGESDEEVEVPMPTMLGVWEAWMGDMLYDQQRQPVRQRFDHGEVCATTNRERFTIVEIGCGDDNSVEAVEEPEMCVYRVRFVTPAACDAEQRDAVRQELTRAQTLFDEFAGGSRNSGRGARSSATRDEL